MKNIKFVASNLEEFFKIISDIQSDDTEMECEDLIDSITSSDEIMGYLNKIYAKKKEMEKDEIKSSSDFTKEIKENFINLDNASAVFSFLQDIKMLSKDLGINYVSRKVIKELGKVGIDRSHEISESAAFSFKLISIAESLPMDEFFNNLSSVMKDPKNLSYGIVKFSEKVLMSK